MSRQGMRERVRGSPDSPRMSDRDRMSPPDDRYEPRPPKYGSRPRSMERDHDRPPPPPPPSREYRSRPRDDYRDPPPYVDHHSSSYDDRTSSYTARRDPEYSSLRITGFPSHVSDMAVRDALFHEFKKFGEVNIRVTYSGEDRVAYANYRLQEDARNARSAKGTRITMFARPLHIDCVFKRYDNYGNNRGRGRGRGYYHQGSDYQSRPPTGGRGYSSESSYERDYDKRRTYSDSGHPHERDVTLLPEEDPKATRTVFVGNLEENVTPEQLRREFEKYGIVEDVDIKFGARGQGNPFAFVKFLNLNMAYKAITGMVGHYVGRNQIKLGYGKISPTSCLWIGGLGTWTSLSVLEREFDRFGAIRKIDYTKGDTFAYIFYETLEAATAAAETMRGYALGGPDRRLRIDFVDPERLPRAPPTYGHLPRSREEPPSEFSEVENEYFRGSKPPTNNYRERRAPDSYGYEKEKTWDRERRDWAPGAPEDGEMPARPVRRKRPHSPDSDYSRGSGPERPIGYKPPRSPEDKAEWSPGPPLEGTSSSPEMNEFEARKEHKRGRSSDSSSSGHLNGKQHKKHKKPKKSKVLNGVTTVRDLVEHFPVAWDGFYGLKNSAFATSMHVVAGDRSLLEVLLPDGLNADENTLRIAQRFRLDQPKLEEVAKRIYSAGPNGYAILVAVPQAEEPKELPTGTQARTLRNLVSYLQQKKAAGVIILPVNQTDEKEKGVLYAFPPCEYAHKHLLTVAPDLGPTPSEEDHFVVIIVKGVA
ncbi:putative RNA-binding protein 15B [Apostichopus japonicus]|uniref:putative RNA-binding protein 15B n=1 Tax=Stichopus japonicus TaxID=307972 RepID=UPI003AB1C41F